MRTIAQLKEQKNAEAKLRKPSPSAAQAPDTRYRQLTVSLATAEANVAAMKARVAEYRRRYNELKAAANAAPQIDAEYTQLTRDYEVTKSSYESLAGAARIGPDLRRNGNESERDGLPGDRSAPGAVRTQGAQPPAAECRWSCWRRSGAELGLAFLLSQIRPTFNDERRLREVSGLQVLGTVVMAWTDAQKARRTRGLVALLISFVSLLSAYAAIMAALVLTVSRA